jgi:hypothetical protein
MGSRRSESSSRNHPHEWGRSSQRESDLCLCFYRSTDEQYIEFDDQYIFICRDDRLDIYSRQTKQVVLAFPSPQTTLASSCAAIYYFDVSDEREFEILSDGPGVDYQLEMMSEWDYHSAWIGRMDVRGRRNDGKDFAQLANMAFSPHVAEGGELLWPPERYDFRA